MIPDLTTLAVDSPTGVFRPRIMGIVNATPDSFSDGGKYLAVGDAVAHGIALSAAGAQVIDVGGESTRPGAVRVDLIEEQRRLLPVIEGLVDHGIVVSVDTMNSATAAKAIELGALVINDVSGGLADEQMVRVAAATGVHFIINHWRGAGARATPETAYQNVVNDVRCELTYRAAEFIIHGVREDRIILDPGLGFAKSASDNWQLLGRLGRLEAIGFPVLVGASRKKFLAGFAKPAAPASDRDPATAIISALAAQAGAWGVRVHDVDSTKKALDVWEAMQS